MNTSTIMLMFNSETLNAALGAEISAADFKVQYSVTRYRPATWEQPEECSEIEYGDVDLVALYDEYGDPIALSLDSTAIQLLIEKHVPNYETMMNEAVWDDYEQSRK